MPIDVHFWHGKLLKQSASSFRRFNYNLPRIMTELQVISSEKNISEKVPLLPPRSDSTAIDIDEVFFLVGTQAERIRCRRKTLTSTSPVFGSIITDAIHNGKDQEVIELPDVQPEHFRNFVKVTFALWSKINYCSHRFVEFMTLSMLKGTSISPTTALH